MRKLLWPRLRETADNRTDGNGGRKLSVKETDSEEIL